MKQGIHLSSAQVDEAVRKAAAEYRVHPGEVMGRARYRPIAHARQLAMWLSRQRTLRTGERAHSYPEIGRAFGVDHTTVLHACKVVEARMAAQGTAG